MGIENDKNTRDQALLKPARWRMAVAVLLLVAVVGVAYHNCYSVPFIFDDSASVYDNMSLRQWSTAFSPPNESGETVSGRPLLNATFAVNYAISDLGEWSYHVGNVLIHILAGLALFGVVRRTLLLPCLRERFGADELWLAWLVTALWLAHPMAAESVTYIVQRAESFMALWYLTAFYCYIRGVENCAGTSKAASRKWMLLTWLACLAGMASKEVMVSAPVMMFLYDRTYIAGSLKAAWRARWRWYAGFAMTWLLLAGLMISTGQRGDTVGFTGEVTWWQYALTQCWALTRYLWQAFWPSSLIFDYGTEVISNFGAVWPQVIAVAALVTGVAVAFWRAPKAGWAGAFFLAVLAPTTTVIPVITQVAAEHRMYLPMAALTALVIVGVYRWLGRRVLWAGLPLVGLLVFMTIERNKLFNDPMALWADVLEKRPESSRANCNYGLELITMNRPEEGLNYSLKAVSIKPVFPEARNNIGYAYACMEKYEDALEHYRLALAMQPANRATVYNNVCFALYKLKHYDRAWLAGEAALRDNKHFTPAIVNMGNILVATGRHEEAEARYKEALEINPRQADALNNWGNVIALKPGHLEEALGYYKRAVELGPRIADAQDNVARLLVLLKRPAEAIPYFEAELELKPKQLDARKNMADALLSLNRVADAAAQYRKMVEQDRGQIEAVCGMGLNLVSAGRFADAMLVYEAVLPVAGESDLLRYDMGNAFALQGRYEASIVHYREAVRINPANVGAQQNLGIMLTQLGRVEASLVAFEAALCESPDSAPIRHNYAVSLGKVGRFQDALEQEKEALRLQPDLIQAREYMRELQRKLKQ